MKRRIKKFLFALAKTPVGSVLCLLWDFVACVQLQFFKLSWLLSGAKKPNEDQVELMRKNVTFIFKSFERQHLAKKLYKNIQHYYPGVNVIIIDDSREPLALAGPGLQVVQLPFNSGLSVGLNKGLALVKTPFVIRMDDDELLTPHSNFHKQLDFLIDHPEVDLVGILPRNFPIRNRWKQDGINEYIKFKMAYAPKQLIIPHGTVIDENHTVFGKVPNIFIARTDKYRAVGYDDNIRMIDHHEFFYRAAGNLVSVLDSSCFVAHMHCPFDYGYQKYRNDILGDKRYIAEKHPGYFSPKKKS